MSDERNFSKRENDETGYISDWLNEIDRIAQQRPEDGNVPRISIMQDVLNRSRGLAPQPDPADVMVVPKGMSATQQFNQPVGAQPQDHSGVSYDADLGNTWAGSAGREARNQRASEEGDQPSYYKNGA